MPVSRLRLNMLALTVLLAAMSGCIFDVDPPNRAPVIQKLTALSDTVPPDGATTLTVQASDPEGADLDYRWQTSAGYFTSGSYDAVADWQAPSYTGPCTLTVTVDDGRDETAGSLIVAVADTTAPHLIVIAPETRFGVAVDRLPLLLYNNGGGVATWEAEFTADWAAPSSTSGSLAAAQADTLWLTADRDDLPVGAHTGTLLITSPAMESWHADYRLGKVDEPAWTYRVVARHPHDTGAFTQGLVWHDGALYEGTGRYGGSTLRRVELETGQVLQQVALGSDYFGEGIAVWQDHIVQLTWLNQTAFVWALDDFAPQGTYTYSTQGWGLTTDTARFIMSDGTSTLRFRDPDTFVETGAVAVTTSTGGLANLNELEMIGGHVWANVWLTDLIVRIDPATGAVTDWLDLTGLLTRVEASLANVLNGIAHDPATGRIFVTGKYWPWLFEIEVVAP